MPLRQSLGSLSQDPHLLTALFELDGETVPVIVDTGATISFIPENGIILRKHKLRSCTTNINVLLADGAVIHIDRKVMIPLKPSGSQVMPQTVPFYINKDADKVLGHEALLGLNVLKLFRLDINFGDNKIRIYHNNRCIGKECPVETEYKAYAKVDTRVETLTLDQQVSSILKRYKSVFTSLGRRPINGYPMRILTTHNRPIYSKPRHYNPDEIVEMKTHIQTLLDSGIIETTNSGYAATSRIIRKKSGAGRLVVNYIPLNAVTLRDSYALPQISDMLTVLQGNKYFSTMDCEQGFYQVLVDARDRHKTAFSTPIGNFQFIRCPFGARNSCAVFQSEMNRILRDGLYSKCMVYVDDIIVFGREKAEHDANLAWVLAQCEKFNVKIKLGKCSFAKTEVDFLGFSINGSSIQPLREKVKSLAQSKPPKDKSELRSIIGKLNFYSRFILNYSKHLQPLRDLFRKNKDFQWLPHHQIAHDKLLNLLSEAQAQVLAPRSEQKVIELCILPDSLEAVCLDQQERLICRTSRFLSSAEENYSFVEKQLLALTTAIKKFKVFLDPDKITIRTPSKELQKALSLVNRPERLDNLLLRMPAGFDKFEFAVQENLLVNFHRKMKDHIPQEVYYIDGACKRNGKENCKASWAVCSEFDRELSASGFVQNSPSNNAAELTAAIECCKIAKERGQDEITIVTDSKYLHSAVTSWIDKWKNNEWKDHKNKPVVNEDLFKKLLDAKLGLQIEWIHVRGHNGHPGNARADLLARSLLDKEAELLCSATLDGNNIQASDEEVIRIKQRITSGEEKELILEGDVIYYVDKRLPEADQKRIYVPQSSRHWLLKLSHDDMMYGGHLGIKKTHRKLVKFWWPKMHQNIEAYIKSCDLCQRFKNPTGLPPGYLHSIPVSKVFEHVHVDIVGPLKQTNRGNIHIITATDALSKWAFARPCQNIRTSEVIKFMEDCILSIHGRPQTIITDRGTQFTSGEWKEFVEKSKMKHNLTTPYHPQSNGIDERLNGTLVRILRNYVSYYQEDWDEKLKWAVFVYNTTVHESTGYSPYQILHGLDPRSPLKNSETHEDHDINEIDEIRRLVRSQARELNVRAQEKQQDDYNSRHKRFNLRIGDLVLVREQVAPTYLSKKFYPKWYGPCAIVSFVGDMSNPRAVTILNCNDLTRKTIAIRDVKPYQDRGKSTNQDDATSIALNKEKGEPQEHTLEENLHSPGYYLSDSEDDANYSREETSSSRLDLTRRNTLTPISSSPRRVTISVNDEVFRYDAEPQESTIYENLIDLNQDLTQATDEDQAVSNQVSTEIINNQSTQNLINIEDSTTSNQTTVASTDNTTYVSPYLCDFIIDDSLKDPDYVADRTTPNSKRPNIDTTTVVKRRAKVHVPTRSYQLRSRGSPKDPTDEQPDESSSDKRGRRSSSRVLFSADIQEDQTSDLIDL